MASVWAPRLEQNSLDRNSGIPLYVQVAQQLEQAILDGSIATGSRLPNEIELADQLALSRPTMRQAIQLLVDKGLVVRKRGVGTQIVGSQVRRTLELSSLYDDLERSGQSPTTVVRDLKLVPVPKHAGAALGLTRAARVVRVRRLRKARGEPLALLTNYLPDGLVTLTTEDLETRGLYRILRESGVRLRVATQTIGARRATESQARDLRESKGAALLTMTRTAYDDTGRAVEFGSHLYRASRYTFELTLVDR